MNRSGAGSLLNVFSGISPLNATDRALAFGEKYMDTFLRSVASDPSCPLNRTIQYQLVDEDRDALKRNETKPKIFVYYDLIPSDFDRLVRNFPQFELVHKPTSTCSHAFARASRMLETELLFLQARINPKDTILDIGGNYAHHIRRGRTQVHCCCPVMDVRDSVRETDRQLALASLSVQPVVYGGPGVIEALEIHETEKERLYCRKPAQVCKVKARTGMCVHVYDIKMADWPVIFANHGLLKVQGVMHFDSKMLYQASGVFENGEIRYSIDKERDTVTFHFVDDNCLGYSHKWSDYCDYVTSHYITGTVDVDGRKETLGLVYEIVHHDDGRMYFTITRALGGMMSGFSMHHQVALPHHEGKVCVALYDYNPHHEEANEYGLVKRSALFSEGFYETVYRHAVRSQAMLTRESLYSYACTAAFKNTVNGDRVERRDEGRVEDIYALTTVCYVRALMQFANQKSVTTVLHRELEAYRRKLEKAPERSRPIPEPQKSWRGFFSALASYFALVEGNGTVDPDDPYGEDELAVETISTERTKSSFSTQRGAPNTRTTSIFDEFEGDAENILRFVRDAPIFVEFEEFVESHKLTEFKPYVIDLDQIACVPVLKDSDNSYVIPTDDTECYGTFSVEAPETVVTLANSGPVCQDLKTWSEKIRQQDYSTYDAVLHFYRNITPDLRNDIKRRWDGHRGKSAPFVCRSAFKLLDIDSVCGLISSSLKNTKSGVLDIGAAPGGFIQATDLLLETLPGGCQRKVPYLATSPMGSGFVLPAFDRILTKNLVLTTDTSDKFLLCDERDYADVDTKYDLIYMDVASDYSGDYADAHENILRPFERLLKKVATSSTTVVMKVFAGFKATPPGVLAIIDRFDTVGPVLPPTTRGTSSEYYLVCNGYFEATLTGRDKQREEVRNFELARLARQYEETGMAIAGQTMSFTKPVATRYDQQKAEYEKLVQSIKISTPLLENMPIVKPPARSVGSTKNAHTGSRGSNIRNTGVRSGPYNAGRYGQRVSPNRNIKRTSNRGYFNAHASSSGQNHRGRATDVSNSSWRAPQLDPNQYGHDSRFEDDPSRSSANIADKSN